MTKIMLVEDDNNLREIYGARLMAEGYQIVSAADGEEALALAVKEKPELIVADVMMPKISGFDMLDILRTTPETKNTKVIIMTALSQPEDRARGESLGADKYLVKSQVTLEDVVAAVHEILGDQGGSSAPANVNESMPLGSSSSPAAPTAAAPPASPPPAPAAPPAQPQTPPADADSTPPPPPQQDDELPKAPGASDAPEPASRKKKVISPINDLSHEREDFLKMVAEEEALEKQATPGASVGPTDDAAQQQANLADSMAEEKKQMDEDIKKMVNDGTIDDEAAAPTVPQGDSDQATAPADTPAATEPAAPAADVVPATQPEMPAAEPAIPQETDSTMPQPGSSFSPDGSAAPAASASEEPMSQPMPETPAAPDAVPMPPAVADEPQTPAVEAPASDDQTVPQPPAENPEDTSQNPASPGDVAL